LSGLLVVGWKEYLTFPDWGLQQIKAKIDTGACSSALGILDYQIEKDPIEGEMVRIRLGLYPRYPERVREVRVPVVGRVDVKNSGGKKERRPVIQATIRIGSVTRLIRMTLANRTGMRCPVLLGREALAGQFVVDVSKRFCQSGK